MLGAIAVGGLRTFGPGPTPYHPVPTWRLHGLFCFFNKKFPEKLRPTARDGFSRQKPCKKQPPKPRENRRNIPARSPRDLRATPARLLHDFCATSARRNHGKYRHSGPCPATASPRSTAASPCTTPAGPAWGLMNVAVGAWSGAVAGRLGRWGEWLRGRARSRPRRRHPQGLREVPEYEEVAPVVPASSRQRLSGDATGFQCSRRHRAGEGREGTDSVHRTASHVGHRRNAA